MLHHSAQLGQQPVGALLFCAKQASDQRCLLYAELRHGSDHNLRLLLQAVAAIGLFVVLGRRYSISFRGKQALHSAARFLGPTGTALQAWVPTPYLC